MANKEKYALDYLKEIEEYVIIHLRDDLLKNSIVHKYIEDEVAKDIYQYLFYDKAVIISDERVKRLGQFVYEIKRMELEKIKGRK